MTRMLTFLILSPGSIVSNVKVTDGTVTFLASDVVRLMECDETLIPTGMLARATALSLLRLDASTDSMTRISALVSDFDAQNTSLSCS